MTVRKSTLSTRGLDLALAGGMRDNFKPILDDPYDPDKNPKGFVNIGTAENALKFPAQLELDAFNFSYGEGPWGCERLRKAMAKHMTKYFHPLKPITSDDLLFANGVTSLCEMLGYGIADPGDAILLSRPIYQAFQMDFGTKAKVQSIFTDFDGVDQFSPKAAEKYEEAFLKAKANGVSIRALLICNPHNPLGQCYPRESLIAFMELCNKYQIHLLVDEIYALSVFDVPSDPHAVPFTSALAIDYTKHIDPSYMHVLYGMSKDNACGGLRLGCIYMQNTELMRAMSAMSNFHWSGNTSERIAIRMLEDEKWMSWFLDTSKERLAAKNKLVRRMLDAEGINYHRGSNAGFFIWVDLRPFLPKTVDEQGNADGWKAEATLVQSFMKAKIFLTPGAMLSAEEPGWFRLIFSQNDRVIKEGFKRLIDTIKGDGALDEKNGGASHLPIRERGDIPLPT
ncbi:MAG: hypothetical protein M1819_001915 [Sarea resinae]|nr:MAG: hypothetical protein M1819_001915 [Sarea resinae]